MLNSKIETFQCVCFQTDLWRFPKARTCGRPDHGRTSHFETEKCLFKTFLLKNLINLTRIVMIKSEFLNTTGMVWPVSSEKWKASLV